MNTPLHPDGNAMKGTPRVDKLTGRYGPLYVVEVCDLARQLERELARAEAQLAIAVKHLKHIEKISTKDGGRAAWGALQKINALKGEGLE